MSKILPRSLSIVDHNTFIKLNKLCMDYYWLQDESEALIELWNICDHESERNLIQDLLNNFVFINSRELKKIGNQVADHIINKWNLDNKKTYIVAISENQEADGSQMFLQSIKDKFSEHDKWKESNFINSLPIAANNSRDNYRLILLDDFIGTGNTVERKILWLRNKLVERGIVNVEIYLVAIAMMKFSIKKLNDLKIIHYSPLILKKGISERLKGKDKSDAVKKMKNMEKKLGSKWNGQFLPSFGYQKSESLYAIEPYNIPNNVFPLFWWPKYKDYSNRKTIFKRLL